MFIRWLAIGTTTMALGSGLACVTEDPCQDYVDYVCDCRADDPEYDCASVRTTYEDADEDVQAECTSELNKLEDEDDAAGVTCGA